MVLHTNGLPKSQSLESQNSFVSKARVVEGRNFKQAVTGELKKKATGVKVVEAQINSRFLERLKKSWVGRVKNIELLRDIKTILKEVCIGDRNI